MAPDFREGNLTGATATTDLAGLRVDAWAAREFSVSRGRAADLIRAGVIRVNGARVKPHRHVKAGDLLEGDVPPDDIPVLAGEPGGVPVVFQDDHLLVVDKPPGMTVHPGAGRRSGTLVNAVLGMGIPLAPAAGEHRPGIVHRLDRFTSGLMVLAKTDSAFFRLSPMVMKHEFRREYLAVVAGVPRPAKGTIDAAMARHPQSREKFTVVPAGGRSAVTHYSVEREFRGMALVRVVLATGRTHQIRVHFAALGWPLVGDGTYGRASGLISRQALHSTHLSFVHPVTGDKLSFTSDLPDDMAALVEGVKP